MKTMIRVLWVILIGTGIFLGGCADKKAKELFETAQLEERQNNSEHARKLYQEIMEEYPDSDYAEPAMKRMSALAD